MLDQKNLFLAIAISLGILLTWQFVYEGPRREQQLAEQQRQAELAQQAAPAGQTGPGGQTAPGSVGIPMPSTIGAGTADGGEKTRGAAVTENRRIPVDSPSLTGSINLENGRIDDVVLRNFRESVDPTSDKITLLSPRGSPDPYFAEFGWLGVQGSTAGRLCRQLNGKTLLL